MEQKEFITPDLYLASAIWILLNPKNAIAFNEPFTRILLSQ
jgi:hypothetical protein